MGGGGQSSNSTSFPMIPAYLKAPLKASAANWLAGSNAFNQMGGVNALLNQQPEATAPLTTGELANIGQLEGIAQFGSPEETAALGQLSQLTSGPIGSSPDTVAAMNAYNQNIAPTINSSIAATGGGRGGNLTAALTQGQTSAYTPLVQQEVQNRENSVGQYAQLGQQRSGDIQSAMNASDLQRQVAQAADTASYQNLQNILGIGQQFLLGPTELLGGSAIGQRSTGSGSSPQGK